VTNSGKKKDRSGEKEPKDLRRCKKKNEINQDFFSCRLDLKGINQKK
jgi:hypothetical protein